MVQVSHRCRPSEDESGEDDGHSKVVSQHRRLLKILLTDELLARNCDQFQWKDDFKKETLQLLAQHAVQV